MKGKERERGRRKRRHDRRVGRKKESRTGKEMV